MILRSSVLSTYLLVVSNSIVFMAKLLLLLLVCVVGSLSSASVTTVSLWPKAVPPALADFPAFVLAARPAVLWVALVGDSTVRNLFFALTSALLHGSHRVFTGHSLPAFTASLQPFHIRLSCMHRTRACVSAYLAPHNATGWAELCPHCDFHVTFSWLSTGDPAHVLSFLASHSPASTMQPELRPLLVLNVGVHYRMRPLAEYALALHTALTHSLRWTRRVVVLDTTFVRDNYTAADGKLHNVGGNAAVRLLNAELDRELGRLAPLPSEIHTHVCRVAVAEYSLQIPHLLLDGVHYSWQLYSAVRGGVTACFWRFV